MSGISRVPTMTNDTTPAPFTISASTDSVNAYKVFDKADSQWIATATTGTHTTDFGSATYAVDQYTIEPQSTTRAPKNWTLLGSNTGTFGGEEVTLDTRTNETSWTTGVKNNYTCNNTTKYRYYRLNITANNGDASNLEIDEVEYYAPDPFPGYAFFM